MQAQGACTAIEDDTDNERQDRMAVAIILQAVTDEMVPMLAMKYSVQEAWKDQDYVYGRRACPRGLWA